MWPTPALGPCCQSQARSLSLAAIRDWCKASGTGTVYIEPGSPWENPFVESFISRARDELFSREVFYSVMEGRVNWCDRYNTKRPPSSIGYLPPGSGLDVSPGHLLQHLDVQGLVGHHAFEHAVLIAQVA